MKEAAGLVAQFATPVCRVAVSAECSRDELVGGLSPPRLLVDALFLFALYDNLMKPCVAVFKRTARRDPSFLGRD